MTAELMEGNCSGVFVEFRDACGNTLAQEVYSDWRGRPLPAIGDTMCCKVGAVPAQEWRKLRGRVVARQFDVQRDERGETCVWVFVVAEACPARMPSALHRDGRPLFSDN